MSTRVQSCSSLCKFFQVTLMLVCQALLAHSIAYGQIEVGLAQVDITPPVGGLTAGYSRAKPTVEVHDPLSARIVLLKSDDSFVALVSCDLCIFNHQELHGQVKDLGIDRLLFTNTHTHAGPKMDQDFPSAENPWRDILGRRVLQAIKQAQSSMFQGYFAASETRLQLGYNRLVQRGDFALTYFDNPERIPYGEVDDQVGVIRVTDESGNIRAVLVSYACHPVVLGNNNIKLSADFPGVTRRIVEEKIGGKDPGANSKAKVMCVFFQGAAGDINPLFLARGEDRSKDFDVVERMGDALATEVLRALSLVEDQPGKCVSFSSRSSESRFQHRFEKEKHVDLGVTSLLINDEIGIVTMPGEPFHKFGKDLRQNTSLKHAYLFGYCSNADYEWPAYLPDLVSAARGGYGASQNTQAEVGAGEKLINDGIVHLFKMRGRLKDTPMRNTFTTPPK